MLLARHHTGIFNLEKAQRRGSEVSFSLAYLYDADMRPFAHVRHASYLVLRRAAAPRSIYPWDWVGDDVASFRALQGGLLVAPILQQLILNRAPIEVLDFADAVAKWPIKRIVPAHLKNDLKYTGKDYRAAFGFLEARGVRKGLPRPLAADMTLLAESEKGLLESGAVARCPPLPGGAASREEILRETVYGCRGDVCAPRSRP
jgi:hypothetical protein